MLAFISAILALPGTISALITQISNLVAAMDRATAAANIQQATKIVDQDIPAANTLEQTQAVAKEIQDLVSKS